MIRNYSLFEKTGMRGPEYCDLSPCVEPSSKIPAETRGPIWILTLVLMALLIKEEWPRTQNVLLAGEHFWLSDGLCVLGELQSWAQGVLDWDDCSKGVV